MVSTFAAVMLAAVAGSVATQATALTLNVVGGQLHGASGVNVVGALYDVEFVDGNCIELFNGCDSADDFAFNQFPEAQQAGLALLDQVFVGQFDSMPELTRGCSGGVALLACNVITPLGSFVGSFFSWVNTGNVAEGRPISNVDSVSLAPSSHGSPVTDTSRADHSHITYARWTLVPEPGTALLMGLGLLVMGIRKRHIG